MAVAPGNATAALLVDLPNVTSVDVRLHEGTCPAWMNSLCNMVLSQALSGLTGIKASIPVAIVAWGSLISDDFPLVLGQGGEWLGTWWACLIFTVFVILEVVSDCFPVVDTVVDGVLLFVKPIVAFMVATAPYYDSHWIEHVTQITSAAISLVMALVKAANTVAVTAGTVGVGTPARSAVETVSVTVLTYVTLWFVIMSFFVAAMCITLVFVVVIHRWRRSRSAIRKENEAISDAMHLSHCPAACDPVDSDDSTISSSEDSESSIA
mmetsp:Transcript_102244/g.305241  ORF Transcript_102244/g.305241 Transcript_102244/m.305241 type:complete len:266 (-) Transcript_102244:78-875(-)